MTTTKLSSPMLPVDIVLAPAWWHTHEGMTFDEDFFYHPAKRVEAERRMEQALYDRWGQFGLGSDRDKDLPQVGAVHLAAGYLLSEMLGCEVQYKEDTPPQVLPANMDELCVDFEAAFHSPAYLRFQQLVDALKSQHGYLTGDVNWSGVLNLALDLRGERFFMDLYDQPDQARAFLGTIAKVISTFIGRIAKETGTTSISVNRTVRHFPEPICLHSTCSLTMISAPDYESFLMPIDSDWSETYGPYGIHYCGHDPHRHAEAFARLPRLDFLDVGWGGDVKQLRKHLPNTFLNIRLSPVEIINQSTAEIREVIIRLVQDSGDPSLTGVCCINMDDKVTDDKITAIFETVQELRQQYQSHCAKAIE
ncbi:MAG: hypothetical protein GY809_15135 [Planctomycetes bacterium]|nr:hypothetical protein [Planctomycetota bacterium]